MVLTEQELKDIDECDRLCENESDYIFCFSHCLRRKGYHEDDIWESIRFVIGIDF